MRGDLLLLVFFCGDSVWASVDFVSTYWKERKFREFSLLITFNRIFQRKSFRFSTHSFENKRINSTSI